MHYLSPDISFRDVVLKNSVPYLMTFSILALVGVFSVGIWESIIFFIVFMCYFIWRNIKWHKYQLVSVQTLSSLEINFQWKEYDKGNNQNFRVEDLDFTIKGVQTKQRAFYLIVEYKGEMVFKIFQNKFWDEKKLRQIVLLKYDSKTVNKMF